MQCDINSASGRSRVVRSKIQERIKCSRWVGIQKCFTQPRLAGFVDGQILPLVPGITETQLPVPRFEIITKFSQRATQAHVEELVPVSELFMSGTGVVNAAKLNPSSYGKTASVRKEIWNSCIRNREWI